MSKLGKSPLLLKRINTMPELLAHNVIFGFRVRPDGRHTARRLPEERAGPTAPSVGNAADLVRV